MKIKTQDLTGAALDWAVARALGKRSRLFISQRTGALAAEHHYSTNWAQGGPLIERGRISIRPDISTPDFRAFVIRTPEGMSHRYIGPTPLISAMRCFVASKFGDEVDVPEELL
jgi:hypothetical protein